MSKQATILRTEINRIFEQPNKRRITQSEAIQVLAKTNGLRNHHVKADADVMTPSATATEETYLLICNDPGSTTPPLQARFTAFEMDHATDQTLDWFGEMVTGGTPEPTAIWSIIRLSDATLVAHGVGRTTTLGKIPSCEHHGHEKAAVATPSVGQPSREEIMAMVADVSWNMGEKYEFETDHGTFVWSSPAQGGDDSLVRNDNDESFQEGRDKGMHRIGEFMRDQHADLTGAEADAMAAHRTAASGHHGRIKVESEGTGLLLQSESGGERYGNGAIRVDGRTFNLSWSTNADMSIRVLGYDQRTRRLHIEGRVAPTGMEDIGPTYSGTMTGRHLGATLELTGSTRQAPLGKLTFVALKVDASNVDAKTRA